MKIRLPRIFRKRKSDLLEFSYGASKEILGDVKEVAPGIFELTNISPKGREIFALITDIEKFDTPTKPIDGHHCPRCETGIAIPPFAVPEYKPFATFPKRCPECGQAIDWSDYE